MLVDLARRLFVQHLHERQGIRAQGDGVAVSMTVVFFRAAGHGGSGAVKKRGRRLAWRERAHLGHGERPQRLLARHDLVHDDAEAVEVAGRRQVACGKRGRGGDGARGKRMRSAPGSQDGTRKHERGYVAHGGDAASRRYRSSAAPCHWQVQASAPKAKLTGGEQLWRKVGERARRRGDGRVRLALVQHARDAKVCAARAAQRSAADDAGQGVPPTTQDGTALGGRSAGCGAASEACCCCGWGRRGRAPRRGVQSRAPQILTVKPRRLLASLHSRQFCGLRSPCTTPRLNRYLRPMTPREQATARQHRVGACWLALVRRVPAAARNGFVSPKP